MAFLFGSAISRNISRQIIETLTEVAINATQGCQTEIISTQGINIIGNKGTDVIIRGVRLSQAVSMNATCLSNATTNTNIKNQLTQAAEQIAKAITQQFSLSNAESENISETIARAAVRVEETFTQTCKATIVNSQVFNIKDNEGGSYEIADQNWSQTVDQTISCVQNIDAVIGVQNEIDQKLKQYAESKVENFFGPLMLIALLVLAALGFITLKGTQAFTNWRVLLALLGVVVGLILLYLLVAYIRGWIPFRRNKA